MTPREEWDDWFAWRPVLLTYSGQRAWLRKIRRFKGQGWSIYEDQTKQNMEDSAEEAVVRSQKP